MRAALSNHARPDQQVIDGATGAHLYLALPRVQGPKLSSRRWHPDGAQGACAHKLDEQVIRPQRT